MNKYYKITINQFEGEGDTLKAQALYEQTVEALNVRKVIEAVNNNSDALLIEPPPATRKRAPRSDRGKKRSHAAAPAE